MQKVETFFYHYLALNKKNLTEKIIEKLEWRNYPELNIINVNAELFYQYLAFKLFKTIYGKELMKNCVKNCCTGLYDVNVLSRICLRLGFVLSKICLVQDSSCLGCVRVQGMSLSRNCLSWNCLSRIDLSRIYPSTEFTLIVNYVD